MKKIYQKIVIFLSFSFFVVVPKALAQWNPGNYDQTQLPAGRIEDIVGNLVMWVLAMFGFIGVIGFVISGIMYLTAAGSPKQEETAKKAMQMSIIGVIVGLVGLVVINAVDSLLDAGGGEDCGILGLFC